MAGGGCGHALQVGGAGDGRWQHDHTHHRRPGEARDRRLPQVPSVQVEWRIEHSDNLTRRNPEGSKSTDRSAGYLQNGVEYPSPYDYSIYTDYLKVI